MLGMVVGAANRTEWLTGTFTQFGCDHIADVMPLLHLYRSAAGSPVNPSSFAGRDPQKKTADPDVLPSLDNKGGLLGSFEIADRILWGIENDIPAAELAMRFGQERTLYIRTLMRKSAYYRETPYSLI